MPSYKLYTPSGSFRAFAPLIAAEYNEIQIEVVTEGIQDVITEKSPTGKAPLLECAEDKKVLVTSHAISRYIASLRQDSNLLGTSLQERMAIDEWMGWVTCDVELPACVLFYPKVGFLPFNERARQRANADFAAALERVQNHLTNSDNNRKFLVNPERITLADIVVACTLLYPLTLACDESFLQPYDKVIQWFEACVNQPEFVTVLGKIELSRE